MARTGRTVRCPDAYMPSTADSASPLPGPAQMNSGKQADLVSTFAHPAPAIEAEYTRICPTISCTAAKQAASPIDAGLRPQTPPPGSPRIVPVASTRKPTEAAQSGFGQSAELADEHASGQQQLQRRLAVARLLFRRGKQEAALAAVDAHSSWPMHADACCLRGRCLAALSDHGGVGLNLHDTYCQCASV